MTVAPWTTLGPGYAVANDFTVTATDLVGLGATMSWPVAELVGLEQSMAWDVEDVPDGASECLDDGRCGAFGQVSVDHLVQGNTRVSWTLAGSLQARSPYVFQLQVGETGNPLADDWQPAGDPATNVFYATDPTRRAFGTQLTVHYRVKMTDADSNVYYSQPVPALGGLAHRDWLNAREIVRKEKLALRQFTGIKGHLLKKRRDGEPCTACLDPFTGECTDSHCQECNGTRIVQGYYRAMPCQYADTTNYKGKEARTNGPEGWDLKVVIQGTFVGLPMLSSGDVWVDDGSDLRYYIGEVEVKVRVRGIPIKTTATLWQYEFNNIVYQIPLDGTP